jgi:hypothetical protein
MRRHDGSCGRNTAALHQNLQDQDIGLLQSCNATGIAGRFSLGNANEAVRALERLNQSLPKQGCSSTAAKVMVSGMRCP